MSDLIKLIYDDTYASSFQTMGQYRSALLMQATKMLKAEEKQAIQNKQK